MRGKSYLQIGSICMGIGGSIIDPAFIEEYLGMRVESVDEVVHNPLKTFSITLTCGKLSRKIASYADAPVYAPPQLRPSLT